MYLFGDRVGYNDDDVIEIQLLRHEENKTAAISFSWETAGNNHVNFTFSDYSYYGWKRWTNMWKPKLANKLRMLGLCKEV